MKKNGLTCVLFDEQPPGTHYKPGHYSWVANSTADEIISDGYGSEYDPTKKNPVERKQQPESDLPDDLPGRNHFEEAGKNWEQVQKLAEKEKLQSVPGIGTSTEHKINVYMEGK